jgi:serine/threonine protein kinase/tetratricopeptide (TPR) repeat protein
MVSQSVSHYRIISKLGAGGMGEVYLAEDSRLRRTVAIKFIQKQNQHIPDTGVRFLSEARAASALNHPNIVTIYEIGETAESSYIVMEHIKGQSLGEKLNVNSLGAEEILEIALQICEALNEAHLHGIIHRDIKPENIFINQRGQVKLLDFGLAKKFNLPDMGSDCMTLTKSLTEAGVIVGTPAYMSPEQLRDEPLDKRTDIFSFGIVLYKIVTGSYPFSGANSIELAASILKERPNQIVKLPPGLPDDIVPIVMRCLEKDRAGRYTSFAEIKTDLGALKRRAAHPTGNLEPTAALKQTRVNDLKAARQVLSAQVPPQPLAPTILVLPLEDASSPTEGSFIGVGLAHAIMTDLAKINGLLVLSKAASVKRPGQESPGARELARELGATMLLEGEVMRAGPKIRVMARLTSVESGYVIWGSQYRGDALDIFSIQDAVCEGVAAALKVSISSAVRQQITRQPTANLAAFEIYSKGRAFIERRDISANIDQAIQAFEKAVMLDPTFALAQAGLCEAYWHKYHQVTGDQSWVEKAIAAGDRALVLDPYQAQVHVSMGLIYNGTGKIDRAVEAFERAVQLQPTSDDAYRWLGRCYQRKSDLDRAVQYFEKAIALRPGYWENYYMLGICYYIFGHYDDAAEQFRQLITIQPDSYHGYDKLGAIYILLGRYEDAIVMHKRALQVSPSFESYSNLGTAYFYLKRYAESLEAYKKAVEINPHNDIMCRNLGDAYLQIGDLRDASAQYQAAREILQARLLTERNQAELLGRLAVCQAKLKEGGEALELINRALELEPNNTTLRYQKAVVCALTGDTDKAIESLGNALAEGYSHSEAAVDPDLEPLRGKPAFEQLLNQSV